MDSKLLHQKGIDLLNQYQTVYKEMSDLEDHVLNYGVKYYEPLPKSKLEDQLTVKRMVLKRLKERYSNLLDSLKLQESQTIL